MAELARHPIRNILLVGLVIRIAIALTAVWPDSESFLLLASRTIVSPGAGAPLDNIYPVTWIMLISLPLNLLGHFMDPSQFVVSLPPQASHELLQIGLQMTNIPVPLAMLCLKLPIIIADILTGFLIYSIIRQFAGDAKAKFAFALWFLNPMIIIESCVFSQYDTIVALMCLLAVYLIIRKSYFGAGLAFALGFLLKPLGLYLGVSLGIYLLWSGFQTVSQVSSLENKPRGKLGWLAGFRPIAWFIGGCIIPVIAFVPGQQLLGVGQSIGARLTFPSLSGINLWWFYMIPGKIPHSILSWGYTNFTAVMIGSLIIGLLLTILITLIAIRKQGGSPRAIYLISITTVVLYPILTTYTGAQYYIPFIAFLTIGVVLFGISNYIFGIFNLSLVAWTLSLWGPVIIWLPLSLNWHLISLDGIINWTREYMSIPGIGSSNATSDIRLFCTIIVLACVTWVVIATMHRLLRKD